jgi:hypothetical protein
VGKLRRGGYIFVSWRSDHPPRHVHVYQRRRLVVKWDLDHEKVMKGFASSRLVALIRELEAERRL